MHYDRVMSDQLWTKQKKQKRGSSGQIVVFGASLIMNFFLNVGVSIARRMFDILCG